MIDVSNRHDGSRALEARERQTTRGLLEWTEAFATAAVMTAVLLRFFGMPVRLFLRLVLTLIRRIVGW
jgi:hypothetical protein